ncbi:MAG: two-component system, NarL family, sensor kinase [Gaiellales bacterium]|jgi:signal transduction histidine kinase|nr:two-component system, NarL family, sensor kinase [Gaiellales bacterium]
MRANPAAGSTHLRPGVAVGQFALAGLLSLTIVLAGGALLLRNHSNAQALDGARALTAQAGRSVVQPRLTAAAIAGDPQALAALDRAVRDGVLADPVVRVKIWAADGRVIYSDQKELDGQRFPLATEKLEALRTGEVVAESSDLAEPEHRFERGAGRLLEVYLPLEGQDGKRYLFETYQREGAVMGMGQDLWFELLPLFAVALLVLFLLQLPAAWALVRRERRARAEREALLVSAVDSSEAERRRIASDLHDGVIQDLAGLAFNLAATRGISTAAAPALEPAERTVRQAVANLRQTLLEIAPPVGGPGLSAALEALADPLRGSGIDVNVTIDPGLDVSPQAEALIVRAAQEALRNVARHSGAAKVDVTAMSGPDVGVLEVRDNGHGFDADRLAERRRAGHVGLSLLTDLTTRLGGRLDIDSGSAGTTVRLEVPT